MLTVSAHLLVSHLPQHSLLLILGTHTGWALLNLHYGLPAALCRCDGRMLGGSAPSAQFPFSIDRTCKQKQLYLGWTKGMEMVQCQLKLWQIGLWIMIHSPVNSKNYATLLSVFRKEFEDWFQDHKIDVFLLCHFQFSVPGFAIRHSVQIIVWLCLFIRSSQDLSYQEKEPLASQLCLIHLITFWQYIYEKLFSRINQGWSMWKIKLDQKSESYRCLHRYKRIAYTNLLVAIEKVQVWGWLLSE